MKKTSLSIGSVSSATLRTEDLIPSFLWECDRLRLTREERKNVNRIKRESQKEGYYDTEDASFDLNEDLFDILNNHCPEFCYFGSHPGDGADFGVFPIEDFEERILEEGIKVNDLTEIPNKYKGLVLLVSDHGNAALYRKSNKLKEVWSLV
jgi:hypothetical protein